MLMKLLPYILTFWLGGCAGIGLITLLQVRRKPETLDADAPGPVIAKLQRKEVQP